MERSWPLEQGQRNLNANPIPLNHFSILPKLVPLESQIGGTVSIAN